MEFLKIDGRDSNHRYINRLLVDNPHFENV